MQSRTPETESRTSNQNLYPLLVSIHSCSAFVGKLVNPFAWHAKDRQFESGRKHFITPETIFWRARNFFFLHGSPGMWKKSSSTVLRECGRNVWDCGRNQSTSDLTILNLSNRADSRLPGHSDRDRWHHAYPYAWSWKTITPWASFSVLKSFALQAIRRAYRLEIILKIQEKRWVLP